MLVYVYTDLHIVNTNSSTCIKVYGLPPGQRSGPALLWREETTAMQTTQRSCHRRTRKCHSHSLLSHSWGRRGGGREGERERGWEDGRRGGKGEEGRERDWVEKERRVGWRRGRRERKRRKKWKEGGEERPGNIVLIALNATAEVGSMTYHWNANTNCRSKFKWHHLLTTVTFSLLPLPLLPSSSVPSTATLIPSQSMIHIANTMASSVKSSKWATDTNARLCMALVPSPPPTTTYHEGLATSPRGGGAGATCPWATPPPWPVLWKNHDDPSATQVSEPL